MKIFSKTVLTSLLFLTFFTLRSQNVDLLKAFINKNSIALRSVQKTSMKISDAKNSDNFKELLKLHLISVKLYGSDKDQSTAAALKVREGSLSYTNKNANQATAEYFNLTDEEKSGLNTKTMLNASSTYLTESELKSIDAIDSMDPSLFNLFSITIQ